MLEVVEVMVQVEVLVQKVIMEQRVPLDQLVYISSGLQGAAVSTAFI